MGDWPESDNAPNYIRSSVSSEIGVRSVRACGCSIFFDRKKKQVETGAVKGNKPSTQEEEKEIEEMGRGARSSLLCARSSSMGVSVFWFRGGH